MANNPLALAKNFGRNLYRSGKYSWQRITLSGTGRKNYTGSIFDRLLGLEEVLEECEGKTVLDVGFSTGLVAYEFARRGASLIHGLEKERDLTWLARQIFRDVPIESQFRSADLTDGAAGIEKRYGAMLLPSYDIVLFLGVYHHLKMEASELAKLVTFLAGKSSGCFVVRTDRLPELRDLILEQGFSVRRSHPGIPGRLGALEVFVRTA